MSVSREMVRMGVFMEMCIFLNGLVGVVFWLVCIIGIGFCLGK